MTRPMLSASFFLLGLFLLPVSAFSAIDAYEFPDEAMEMRYHRLIQELRCPQCLNTNLAGSDAMIAQDLRNEVHEQILAGRSDQEILDFMQARYGDFVLYRPPLKASTVLLWTAPIGVFLLGIFLVTRVIRRAGSRLQEANTVEPEETTSRVEQLLDGMAKKSHEPKNEKEG